MSNLAAENVFYTTAQAAEIAGIKDSTLRNYKRDYPERLVEGIHHRTDGGQTWWHSDAIAIITQIKTEKAGGSVADFGNTEKRESLQRPTLPDAGDGNGGTLEALLRPIAQTLGSQGASVLRRLILEESVGQALAVPATSAECVAVLEKVGIGGCNPAALVGSRAAGLLEGGEDE